MAGAVKLDPGSYRETSVKDHLRPRSRAGWSVGEVLRVEIGELEIGKQRDGTGSSGRGKSRRVCHVSGVRDNWSSYSAGFDFR